MKPPTFALALLACSPLVLSACGGAGTASLPTAGSSTAASSSAATGARAVHPSPTRAQAQAFSRAVNLIVSDIPEAAIAPRHLRSITARERREYSTCEEVSATTRGLLRHTHVLVHASSPKLKRGRELEVEEIASSVTVLSDERAIAPEFAVLRSPALRACFARVLTRNFSTKAVREAHWGHFTVSRLPISTPGASDAFAIRVTGSLNFSYSEVSVPIYVDFLGFAVGPGVVTLIAASPTQPVPSATERELVTLLLTRARSQPLQ